MFRKLNTYPFFPNLKVIPDLYMESKETLQTVPEYVIIRMLWKQDILV